MTSIGSEAFAQCARLTSVTIPGSVTNIGVLAFWSSGLTSLTILGGITSIGEYAFKGCTSLGSVAIPDGVRSIAAGAFMNCASLTSVALPNSLTNIGSGASQASATIGRVFVLVMLNPNRVSCTPNRAPPASITGLHKTGGG